MLNMFVTKYNDILEQQLSITAKQITKKFSGLKQQPSFIIYQFLWIRNSGEVSWWFWHGVFHGPGDLSSSLCGSPIGLRECPPAQQLASSRTSDPREWRQKRQCLLTKPRITHCHVLSILEHQEMGLTGAPGYNTGNSPLLITYIYQCVLSSSQPPASLCYLSFHPVCFFLMSAFSKSFILR